MKKIFRSSMVIITMVLFTLLNQSLPAATQAEINQAIQDGLAWLATQQQGNGQFGIGTNPVAYTAAAVLAFENEGHFPGGGTAYSTNVENGLNFIFQYARIWSIGLQPAGDPDGDGDGIGVSFYDDLRQREVYETGMVMQAIAASNTPARVITTGPCVGWTYAQIMQDLVDWAAWGQVDGGSGRGGWRYWANYYDSDNSTAQWPVLGLVAAEQWGIFAPQFVKDELNIWIDYIQNDVDGDWMDGGSGYHNPTTYVNCSKTGGLLVEMYYVNDNSSNPTREDDAQNFLNSRWNVAPSGTWYGNKGHSYAMFSVFKGLELLEITNIPNAPANDETPAGDWWGDYCEYIVSHQYSNGSWPGYSHWNQWLTAGWYIVILQATVFPVEVAVDFPDDCGCSSGYDVTVRYSAERFEAEGALELFKLVGSVFESVEVITLDPFIGSHEHTFHIESDATGVTTWKAVLDVTGGGINVTAEDQATLTVCESPVVAGIPDQYAPFDPINLDDYVTPDDVSWSVDEVPAGWTVTITDGVATIDPGESVDPVTLTFTASRSCCDEVFCTGSDDATFTPIKLVDLDIKPCSWPNPYNVKSQGVLPVAVLGTAEFDVSEIDPGTILLEGVAPLRWEKCDVVGIAPVDACNVTEEGPDGFVDLTLKFDKPEITAALGEVNDGDELVLTLTGNLFSGLPIEGDDCIVILKKGKMKKDVAMIDAGLPDDFELNQNYPNPFNPETTIRFGVPENSFVSIIVSDILGAEVAVLLAQNMQAGYYEVSFDGSNLPSGIYLYSMQTSKTTLTKKLLLLK